MEMACGDKNFESFVSNNRFIGKGTFGYVYGPFDWNGMKCAIKKRMFSKEELDDKKHRIIITACQRWMSLHNEHLITVHDVSLEPPAVYVLMEYASGGSLQKVLCDCESDLPLEILLNWGIQIAEGMAYLHGKRIVHRDLKSPNIVIMESGASSNPYNKTLKITDFDQIREHDVTKTMTTAGTYAWTAPEVFTERCFSKASDVWSYGVVLWELLTRNLPHKDVPDYVMIVEALKGSLKLKIPDSCTAIIKSILNSCQSKEKHQRPSFDKILRDLQPNREDGACCLKENDGAHSTTAVSPYMSGSGYERSYMTVQSSVHRTTTAYEEETSSSGRTTRRVFYREESRH